MRVLASSQVMLALDRTGETSLAPSAVTFGLSAAHVILCHKVIGDAGLRVEVARGALGVACNDIAEALPQVVVTSDAIGDEGLALLEDVAIAVGAVFLVLEESTTLDLIALEIEAAVVVATERVEYRSSHPPAS